MMKPFRFWVQTVLPLVYDDSLSYYELLNKVIKYINDFIKQENQFAEVIEEYTAKVDEIKAYVEGYFDSTDFKQTVEEALDKMAEDGELDAIIRPVLDALAADINQRVSDVEEEVSGYSEQISGAVTAAGNAETAVGELEGRVDDLEAQIGGSGEVWKLAAVSGSWQETVGQNTVTRRLGNALYLYKGNKAILFDGGNQYSGAFLMSSLRAHGVDTISAIVVSHYHADHIAGLDGILANYKSAGNPNGFDFSECVMFRPHTNIVWGLMQNMPVDYSAVKTRIDNEAVAAGCSFVDPTENQSAEIDNIKLVFNNLSSDKFSQYYSVYTDEDLLNSGHTQYNNFCMTCSVYIGNNKVLIPSDIQPEAQALNRGVVSGATVYVVEHHGLDLKTDPTYLGGISAVISVVCAYGNNFDNAIRLKYPTFNRCSSVGSLYSTRDREVVVNISTYGVSCESDAAYAYPDYAFQNVLSVGTQLVAGADFNALTTPGIYTVQNRDMLALMSNYPEEAKSGGKLLVMAGSTSGAINQYYLCSNRVTPVICCRCFAVGDDSGWRPWKILRASRYDYHDIVDSDMKLGLGVEDNTESNYQSRAWVQNGVFNVNMGIIVPPSTDVAKDAYFIEIPIDLPNGYWTNFIMVSDTGEVVSCTGRVYSGGRFMAWANSAFGNSSTENTKMYRVNFCANVYTD